jgi:hypothetical protein
MAGALAAVAVVALYFPVSQELTRRRAVLAIRAAGGQVSFAPRAFVSAPGYLGEVGRYWSSLDAHYKNGQREGRIYSLESVEAITLPPGAGDEQLAYVCDLPEVAILRLDDSTITQHGLSRVAAELTPTSLGLRHVPITDELLGELAANSWLQRLDLSGTPITDDGLRHLAGAASLQNLILSETAVHGEGLRHLAGLSSLTRLDLRGTRVTDDGLQHIGNMTGLQWLYLEETPITTSGLRHLKPLQALEELRLSRTELKGPGLGQLSGLPQLVRLDLEGARLDEVAFQELSQFGKAPAAARAPMGRPGLFTFFLNLDATNVTDDWLGHLTGARGRGLGITLCDTDVSEQGLRGLRKSVPYVQGGKRSKAEGPWRAWARDR